jgi:hypothetical protein
MVNRERHNEASELDHMGRSPDIYAANIENSGDCRVMVQLDRQHGAPHGTNPEPRLAVRRGLTSRLMIVPIPKRQIHTHETKSLRLG